MDKTLLQPLKGFRDFLPEESKKRQYAIGKIKETFEKFGFEPLETPAIEYKEFLLGKYGEEADKLVYSFTDNGGREVALRYDQTVPTARILATYNQQLPMPWRRYQIQTVWRAENTQKGRYREFLQCDADLFGSVSPMADAEIVSLANSIFDNLGFKDINIFINDRKILFDILELGGIPERLQMTTIQSIDKLDRKSKDEIREELNSKGLTPKMVDHLYQHLEITTASDNLKKVMEYAQELGVPVSRLIFLPSLARGLDYYTGTIFEIKVKGYEAGSILGGGRYDKLIGELSGVDIPAVGFAVGFDRTIEAMEQFDLFPKENKTSKVLVTVFNDDLVKDSEFLVANLRKEGIPSEIYPDPLAKLEKQLKYADKKGIKWLIVVGPEEAKKNSVILKNLETGAQEEIKLKDLVIKLKEPILLPK